MTALRLLLLLLLIVSCGQAQDASEELLLDATWVPCADSTESLYIMGDGRAIYALYDQGTVFTIGKGLLADLARVVGAAVSVVDRDRLDSCATIGVILGGPRFLLINGSRPAPVTKELHERLEQLRRYARKRLGTMERLAERASEVDTALAITPSVESETLAGLIYAHPVAIEWRCRGSVVVTAMVGADGRVRRAFVDDAQVRGKCASLLTMTALRAVMLAPFIPALKTTGADGAAWKRVQVVFGRR